jgi:hypothetical protein
VSEEFETQPRMTKSIPQGADRVPNVGNCAVTGKLGPEDDIPGGSPGCKDAMLGVVYEASTAHSAWYTEWLGDELPHPSRV